MPHDRVQAVLEEMRERLRLLLLLLELLELLLLLLLLELLLLLLLLLLLELLKLLVPHLLLLLLLQRLRLLSECSAHRHRAAGSRHGGVCRPFEPPPPRCRLFPTQTTTSREERNPRNFLPLPGAAGAKNLLSWTQLR